METIKVLRLARFALAGAIFGVAVSGLLSETWSILPDTDITDWFGSGAGAVAAGVGAKLVHAI